MFSGLNSIADLNQQFSQFANNLSLDNLQDDKDKDKNLETGNGKKGSSTESQSAELEHLREQNERLESEVTRLHEVIATNKTEISDLRNQINNNEFSHDDIEEVQNELENVKDQLKKANTKGKQVTKELNNAKKAEASVRKAFEDYKEESEKRIFELDEKMEEMRRNYEEQIQDLHEGSKETEGLKSPGGEKPQGEISTEKYNKLDELLKKSKEKNNGLKEKLTVNNKTIKELEGKIKKLEQDYTSMKNENLELKEAKSQLEDKIEEFQSNNYEENLEKSEQKIRNLTQSLEKLKKDHGKVQKDKKLQYDELQRLQEQYDELQNKQYENEEKQRSSSATQLSQLQRELSASKNSFNIVEGEKKSLELEWKKQNDSISTLTQKNLELIKNLDLQANEIEKSKTIIQKLENDLKKKDDELTNQELKLTNMTGKLNDLVQKFVDLKNKDNNMEKEAGVKMSETQKQIQAKESEILGLRLKMESLEQSAADNRLRASDITDKFNTINQDFKNLTKEKNQLEEQLEISKTQILSLESALEHKNSEYLALEVEFNQLSDICKTEAQKFLAEKEKILGINEVEKAKADEIIRELQAEILNVNSRLKAETDSAEVLEGYKKRAQIALKKANNTNTQLSTQIETLKETAQNETNRAVELELKLEKLQVNEKDLKQTIENLENEVLELNNLLQEKREEFDSKISEFQNSISKLKQQVNDQKHYHENHQKPSQKAEKPSENVQNPEDEEIEERPKKVSEVPPKSWVIAARDNKNNNINDKKEGNEQNLSMSESAGTSLNEMVEVPLSAEQVQLQRQEKWELVSSELGSSPVSLLFVNELTTQLEMLKKELAERGIEVEATHQELQLERAEKSKLKNKVEELMAFLERTKRLHEGPDSAINMEYLKNCVLRFMSSKKISEKKRLYPVISTIFKFTEKEIHDIEDSLECSEEQDTEISSAISNFATSFSGIWGSVVGGDES